MRREFKSGVVFIGVSMSAEGGFEFRKFSPRTNVRADADRLLREFLRENAPGAPYKAFVADQGEQFWISLVIQIQGRFFSSEAYWSKKQVVGRARDWQVEEIARLLLDLRQQIRNWERTAVVVPVPVKGKSE